MMAGGSCLSAQRARRVLLLIGMITLLTAASIERDWFAARPALAVNGLTITKKADGNPLIGGPITYTVTVTNDGFPAGANNPDGKAYNLNIVDQLPPNVRFVSSPAGSPTLSYTGTTPNIRQTLTFTNITDLARNQTYALSYTATLAPQAATTPASPGVTTPGTVLDNSATALVSADPRGGDHRLGYRDGAHHRLAV